MIREMRALASWYGYVLRYEALETWRAMPGPWWAKIITFLVCLAIPGFFDELALIAIVKFARARKARRERR